MPARLPKSKTVRIGHIALALLPGETAKRIEQISRNIRDEWGPMNIVEEFDCDTIVHALFKLERYEQRSGWRVGGQGSPGIDPFGATMVQLGVSRSF